MQQNDPCQGPNAKALVDIRIGDRARDFTILGMDGAGALQQIFTDRADFDKVRREHPQLISETENDAYRSTVCYDKTGLVGMLLMTGQGPFPMNLPLAQQTPVGRAVDSAWLQNFSGMARQKGWKTEMVWYRVVDDTPG
jgi:hypothetical protein